MPPKFFAGGIEGFVYVGLVPSLLAATGFFSAPGRQRRWAVPSLAAGCTFAAPSHGPKVRFLTKPTRLPAPGRLLFRTELARFLGAPGRLGITTTLCVSLLASLGLAFLLQRFERRWRRVLALCLVGIGLVLEFSSLPFPSSSTAEPRWYDAAVKPTERCTLPAKRPNRRPAGPHDGAPFSDINFRFRATACRNALHRLPAPLLSETAV